MMALTLREELTEAIVAGLHSGVVIEVESDDERTWIHTILCDDPIIVTADYEVLVPHGYGPQIQQGIALDMVSIIAMDQQSTQEGGTHYE